MCKTLINGHRPAVLRYLTIIDVRAATVEVIEGDEPEDQRTYMCISISQHKTSKTYGSACISLPVQQHKDLLPYIQLIEPVCKVRPSTNVYLTVAVSPIKNRPKSIV